MHDFSFILNKRCLYEMSFLFHHGNAALKILGLGYHRWKNAWEKKLAWEVEVWENPLQTLTTDILKSQLSVVFSNISRLAPMFLQCFPSSHNPRHLGAGRFHKSVSDPSVAHLEGGILLINFYLYTLFHFWRKRQPGAGLLQDLAIFPRDSI